MSIKSGIQGGIKLKIETAEYGPPPCLLDEPIITEVHRLSPVILAVRYNMPKATGFLASGTLPDRVLDEMLSVEGAQGVVWYNGSKVTDEETRFSDLLAAGGQGCAHARLELRAPA